MDKEKLIKKACYLVDLIEDVLAAVESRKPAESLPLYHYKPEEYTPAEDTLAMIKKAFGERYASLKAGIFSKQSPVA